MYCPYGAGYQSVSKFLYPLRHGYLLFGFVSHKLDINAIRHIIPNTFHVRYGPKGQFDTPSSSTPANSLHRNPATNGAKALANDANPCANPFKTPNVPFDGAELVTYVNVPQNHTNNIAHVKPSTLASVLTTNTPTNSTHKATFPP